ncbi:MAG: hypothetical protein ACLT33_01375 [Lachnospira pectinoschiza]
MLTTKTGLRVDGWAEINPETGKASNKEVLQEALTIQARAGIVQL